MREVIIFTIAFEENIYRFIWDEEVYFSSDTPLYTDIMIHLLYIR